MDSPVANGSCAAADQLVSTSSVPFGAGSALLFERVQRAFRALGFHESVIRRHYLLDESGPATVSARSFDADDVTVSAGLDALVHLFIGQEAIRANAVYRAIGSRLFADLHELGLIAASSDECGATIRAEGLGDIIVCADRVHGRAFNNEQVFDVVLLVDRERSLISDGSDQERRARSSTRTELLIQVCTELGIERILITGLIIRRKQGRAAVTLRHASVM